jgi:hypothetical protein
MLIGFVKESSTQTFNGFSKLGSEVTQLTILSVQDISAPARWMKM